MIFMMLLSVISIKTLQYILRMFDVKPSTSC